VLINKLTQERFILSGPALDTKAQGRQNEEGTQLPVFMFKKRMKGTKIILVLGTEKVKSWFSV